MDEHLCYVQVVNTLRTRIQEGDLKPGQLTPSIKDICRETGYSRQTAGRALQVLESEGLITRVPGHGYYVA
jgi:GntR family transcriptional regulator